MPSQLDRLDALLDRLALQVQAAFREFIRLVNSETVAAALADRIEVGDINGAITADGFRHHIALSGHAANLLDLRAVEGLLADHHLEAVVVGRVMAAGHHRRAIGFQGIGREIEHWCRAKPNPHDFQPASTQARHELCFHFGRMEPAIIANRDARPAATADNAAKAAANGKGVFRIEGFADNAANIIFAKHGWIEAVIESGHGAGSQGRPMEE